MSCVSLKCHLGGGGGDILIEQQLPAELPTTSNVRTQPCPEDGASQEQKGKKGNIFYPSCCQKGSEQKTILKLG